MTKTATETIDKLIECDDFHNKQSCKLDHIEITYLLDYIYFIEEQNQKLKELCNKYEIEHNTIFQEWKEVIKNG